MNISFLLAAVGQTQILGSIPELDGRFECAAQLNTLTGEQNIKRETKLTDFRLERKPRQHTHEAYVYVHLYEVALKQLR